MLNYEDGLLVFALRGACPQSTGPHIMDESNYRTQNFAMI